jgi:hypothetical protein
MVGQPALSLSNGPGQRPGLQDSDRRSAGFQPAPIAEAGWKACATKDRLDLPPHRGGLRNLSGRAICIAAESTSELRALGQNPTNSYSFPSFLAWSRSLVLTSFDCGFGLPQLATVAETPTDACNLSRSAGVILSYSSGVTYVVACQPLSVVVSSVPDCCLNFMAWHPARRRAPIARQRRQFRADFMSAEAPCAIEATVSVWIAFKQS